MAATATYTRSATSTCTKSRVEAVLDIFCGDLAGFIANDLLSRDRAAKWLVDLADVLVLEAVERFQVQITFPSGRQIGLDYEVSDDGSIKTTSDTSGGFSSTWIPPTSKISLVVRWRTNAPKLEQARQLLHRRGWGPASILGVTGAADRTYSEGGYGVRRRFAGEWE